MDSKSYICTILWGDGAHWRPECRMQVRVDHTTHNKQLVFYHADAMSAPFGSMTVNSMWLPRFRFAVDAFDAAMAIPRIQFAVDAFDVAIPTKDHVFELRPLFLVGSGNMPHGVRIYMDVEKACHDWDSFGCVHGEGSIARMLSEFWDMLLIEPLQNLRTSSPRSTPFVRAETCPMVVCPHDLTLLPLGNTGYVYDNSLSAIVRRPHEMFYPKGKQGSVCFSGQRHCLYLTSPLYDHVNSILAGVVSSESCTVIVTDSLMPWKDAATKAGLKCAIMQSSCMVQYALLQKLDVLVVPTTYFEKHKELWAQFTSQELKRLADTGQAQTATREERATRMRMSLVQRAFPLEEIPPLLFSWDRVIFDGWTLPEQQTHIVAHIPIVWTINVSLGNGLNGPHITYGALKHLARLGAHSNEIDPCFHCLSKIMSDQIVVETKIPKLKKTYEAKECKEEVEEGWSQILAMQKEIAVRPGSAFPAPALDLLFPAQSRAKDWGLGLVEPHQVTAKRITGMSAEEAKAALAILLPPTSLAAEALDKGDSLCLICECEPTQQLTVCGHGFCDDCAMRTQANQPLFHNVAGKRPCPMCRNLLASVDWLRLKGEGSASASASASSPPLLKMLKKYVSEKSSTSRLVIVQHKRVVELIEKEYKEHSTRDCGGRLCIAFGDARTTVVDAGDFLQTQPFLVPSEVFIPCAIVPFYKAEKWITAYDIVWAVLCMVERCSSTKSITIKATSEDYRYFAALAPPKPFSSSKRSKIMDSEEKEEEV